MVDIYGFILTLRIVVLPFEFGSFGIVVDSEP